MAQLSFLTYLRGIYKLNLGNSGVVHDAIIQSLYDCFVMAEGDVDQMRLEMCLSTASGTWLDTWGDYFSVYRKSDETDEHYSKRIINTVIQPKSTIPAIKDHIVDFLNSEYNKSYTRDDVIIKEPWKELAKYSHIGELSHTSRFFSGNYYCHAVIDVSIPEDTTVTKELIDLVKSVKAAGVKVIWSIFNNYDIISEYSTKDEVKAAYHRLTQMTVKKNRNRGLILSQSTTSPTLSGNREYWSILDSLYQWFCIIHEKDTNKSIIINDKDLAYLFDYYTILQKSEEDVEELFNKIVIISNSGELSTSSGYLEYPEDEKLGDDGSYVEKYIKLTEDMLKSLEVLDKFMTLSNKGELSNTGLLSQHLPEHDLFADILESVQNFRKKNTSYFNALQPPIVGAGKEIVQWYVKRNKNWLWNTYAMSYKDLNYYYEPFHNPYKNNNNILINNEAFDISYDGQDGFLLISDVPKEKEEITIDSIVDYEDCFEEGYLTFGDLYQPPIVVGIKQYLSTRDMLDWLFDSPVFTIDDLDEIMRRQYRYSEGKVDNPEPTIEEMINLEERFNIEGYSTSGGIVQPMIEIVSTPIS